MFTANILNILKYATPLTQWFPLWWRYLSICIQQMVPPDLSPFNDENIFGLRGTVNYLSNAPNISPRRVELVMDIDNRCVLCKNNTPIELLSHRLVWIYFLHGSLVQWQLDIYIKLFICQHVYWEILYIHEDLWNKHEITIWMPVRSTTRCP